MSFGISCLVPLVQEFSRRPEGWLASLHPARRPLAQAASWVPPMTAIFLGHRTARTAAPAKHGIESDVSGRKRACKCKVFVPDRLPKIGPEIADFGGPNGPNWAQSPLKMKAVTSPTFLDGWVNLPGPSGPKILHTTTPLNVGGGAYLC